MTLEPRYTTKNKGGFEYRARITEWLSPEKIFRPRQIMTRDIAENRNWTWWKSREATRSRITNKEWMKLEQKRLAAKGIITKFETRGTNNDRTIALFEKERVSR